MAQSNPPDSTRLMNVSYGNRGIELKTPDNRFLFHLQSRLQFRFAIPSDQDPVTFNDFDEDEAKVFKINRARLKVGGHAFQPWVRYYWEYELSQTNLLDFRVMIEKWPWLSLKVGQWKIEFTRERFISSGEQQMVDRSLLNRPFTIDRQQGVELYGHLAGGGIANFNYWAAVLTGTGRGSTENDDNALMYFGRLQWNFLGRKVEFSGSDLEIHEQPAAILAVAAVTNSSPYTRFSQAGGGSLIGYEDGQPGQYRVNQINVETALVYRGFSWQSEVHAKNIVDKLNNSATTPLRGYYLQLGYFIHEAIEWWPQPLEIAFRHSTYYPDYNSKSAIGRENSFAANWFFNGHKNKLTAETSYFKYTDIGEFPADEWRFRIQWEISI